ncbi:MAG: DUF4097 family beta strand repeat protein [Verrucomicrobia bacterium]|nr:DUF4097 family beta strand repeat protein [Verrucomicrobiota bacterium]
MKTIPITIRRMMLLSVTAFLLTVPTLRADTEDRIKKSFTVTGEGQLLLRADRGSVEVGTTDGDKIEVEVIRTVKHAKAGKAADIFKNHEVTFSQRGNDIEIRADNQPKLKSMWNDLWRQFQVRYVINVPRKFNLDLKTAGGSITVADLTGKLRGETSGGNLRFGRVQGPVWGKSSGGSIEVVEAGGKLDAETSGGSIRITKASADARLKTSGGNIRVGESVSKLDARTSGGSIRIEKATAEVAAHTAGGDIEIESAAGAVDASTSGGSITFRLSAQPKGDCRGETSGGNINVYLADNLGFNLDAKTSGGRVVTDLPVTVQGEHKSSSLHGKLNAGGPNLTLRTSGGSIHLKKL